jgi:hypothetical protein
MTKAAFNKKGGLFDSQLKSNFRKKPVKCYILNTVVCGAKLEHSESRPEIPGNF